MIKKIYSRCSDFLHAILRAPEIKMKCYIEKIACCINQNENDRDYFYHSVKKIIFFFGAVNNSFIFFLIR